MSWIKGLGKNQRCLQCLLSRATEPWPHGLRETIACIQVRRHNGALRVTRLPPNCKTHKDRNARLDALQSNWLKNIKFWYMTFSAAIIMDKPSMIQTSKRVILSSEKDLEFFLIWIISYADFVLFKYEVLYLSPWCITCTLYSRITGNRKFNNSI